MGDPKLKPERAAWLDAQPPQELGISVFSLWEVAKLVALGRLNLPDAPLVWMNANLAGSGVTPIPLSKEIAVESNNLPGIFHRDPADQIIAATARLLDCDLLTVDARILSYEHVKAVAP